MFLGVTRAHVNFHPEIIRTICIYPLQVISQYENMTVEDNVFDQFMLACDKTQAPNGALLDAVALTKDSGIK